MSKHHNNYNRNNYSKMYNAKEETPEVEETVVIPEPEVVPEVTEVVPEVVEVEEIIEAPVVVEGVISDCTKLNIRSAPSMDGDIVTVLYAGTKLTIDLDQSNDEWYSICTLHGIEGFCMKKFVAINE